MPSDQIERTRRSGPEAHPDTAALKAGVRAAKRWARAIVPLMVAFFVATAGAALAARTPAHHTRHQPSPQRTRSCPSWRDGGYGTTYTKVRPKNLSCAIVRRIEAKLAPKLASGSGPNAPVAEVVGKLMFTCSIELHLTPHSQLTGAGACAAPKHRSFTFIATVSGQ